MRKFNKKLYPRNIWKNPENRLNDKFSSIAHDYGSNRDVNRWRDEIYAIIHYNPKLEKKYNRQLKILDKKKFDSDEFRTSLYVKEHKMKKSELRNIIKEELANVMLEAHIDKVVKSEKDFNRYNRFDGPNAYHNYYYSVDNLLRKKRENPPVFKYVMGQFGYQDSDKDLEKYVAKSGSRQNMWFREWDKILRNIRSGHFSL